MHYTREGRLGIALDTPPLGMLTGAAAAIIAADIHHVIPAAHLATVDALP